MRAVDKTALNSIAFCRPVLTTRNSEGTRLIISGNFILCVCYLFQVIAAHRDAPHRARLVMLLIV